MIRITPQSPKPSSVKLCSNCKYFRKLQKPLKEEQNCCTLFGTVDLIEGVVTYDNAYKVRQDSAMCGVNAVYFKDIRSCEEDIGGGCYTTCTAK